MSDDPIFARLFPIVWLIGVATFGVFSAVRLVKGLKTGTISNRWRTIERSDEPFEFRMAALAKVGEIVLAIAMFAFGLHLALEMRS